MKVHNLRATDHLTILYSIIETDGAAELQEIVRTASFLRVCIYVCNFSHTYSQLIAACSLGTAPMQAECMLQSSTTIILGHDGMDSTR